MHQVQRYYGGAVLVGRLTYHHTTLSPLSAALHPAHDETINYSRGVGTAVVSKTEQRLQIQSTSSNQGASPAKTAPPTTSAAPPTSAAGKKPRTPILLYKWSFKVMAEDMVVLLGYRRYDSRLVFSIQLITPLSPSLTHSLSPRPLSLSYSLSLLTLSLSIQSKC